MAAAFAKDGTLAERPGYKVNASRRDGPGQAEIHTRATDVIYVVEGSATFVTGGKAIDPKEVAPNEIRGRAIEGGEAHQISEGRCRCRAGWRAALVQGSARTVPLFRLQTNRRGGLARDHALRRVNSLMKKCLLSLLITLAIAPIANCGIGGDFRKSHPEFSGSWQVVSIAAGISREPLANTRSPFPQDARREFQPLGVSDAGYNHQPEFQPHT